MKKLIYLPFFFFLFFGINESNAQLKIGDHVTHIQPSSLLELESTSQGVLFPRMTTLQRDAISSALSFHSDTSHGLTIYNTTQGCINFWNHNAGSGYWVNVCDMSWKILGNSGTNSGINFLGTTDNKSLRFRTNNLARMAIDSNGNIGIGTSFPAQKVTAIANMNAASTGLGNADGYRFTTYISPAVNLTTHSDAQNPFHNIGEVPSSNTKDISTVRAMFSQAINNGNQANIVGNLEGTVGEARNYNGSTVGGSVSGGFFGSWNYGTGLSDFQNGVSSYTYLAPGGNVDKLYGVRVRAENYGNSVNKIGIHVAGIGDPGTAMDYGIKVTGFADPLCLEGMQAGGSFDSMLVMTGKGVVKYQAHNVTPITTTTSNITLTSEHYTVLLTGLTPSVTLPSANLNAGRSFTIVNYTAGARNITSYISLGNNIVSTIPANTSITVQSTGTFWYRIK